MLIILLCAIIAIKITIKTNTMPNLLNDEYLVNGCLFSLDEPTPEETDEDESEDGDD